MVIRLALARAGCASDSEGLDPAITGCGAKRGAIVYGASPAPDYATYIVAPPITGALVEQKTLCPRICSPCVKKEHSLRLC